MTELDWLKKAACLGKDPLIFFPNGRKQDEPEALRAKVICSNCVVRIPCLEDALSLPIEQQDGVLGGRTAKERIAIKKQRKKKIDVMV